MENDAATTETQIRRLEQVYEQLEAELQQPSAMQRLRHAPSDDEWSAMQILGHMVEIIPYWLHECQELIVATGNPPQFGRANDAPERLEGVEHGTTKNLDELMRLLKHEIMVATENVRAMTSTDRAKKGIHIRKGEMAVTDILETFVISHAEDHLEQLCMVLRV